MDCPYAYRCRRYVYSCYLIDHGYKEGVPTVQALELAGYADIAAVDRSTRIYAENFPSERGGKLYNICPEILDRPYVKCPEYLATKKKDRKREENLKRKKESIRKNAMRYRRAPIRREVRHKVARDADFKCFYCGRHVTTKVHGEKVQFCVDHRIPIARGGPDEISNYVYCCVPCNSAKRAQSAEDWQPLCRKGYYD